MQALNTSKVKQAAQYRFDHPNCTRKDFANALYDLTSHINSGEYKRKANSTLYAWAKFICDCLDNPNVFTK
jgi:hypothetical protein